MPCAPESVRRLIEAGDARAPRARHLRACGWRSIRALLVSVILLVPFPFGVVGFGPQISDVQADEPPMPVISRGVPAFGSAGGNPASNANDGDYATVWRSGTAPRSGGLQWLVLQ